METRPAVWISRVVVLLAQALVVAGGCADREADRARTDSTDASADGAPVVVTTVVSAAHGGRVVSSDGKAVLVVPPGALDADVAISVRVLPAAMETATPVYDFGPDGLAFKNAARFELAIDAVLVARAPRLAMTHGQGFERIPSHVEDAKLVGDVAHFTGFAGVVDPNAPPASMTIAEMAAGPTHTCFVEAPAGLVKCWGVNGSGQIGSGTFERAGAPTAVVGLANVQKVAVGWRHTCALVAGGAVKCWGSNAFGQLGLPHDVDGGPPSYATPQDVPGLTSDVVALSASANRTCALHVSGSLFCFGEKPEHEWRSDAAAAASGIDAGAPSALRLQRPLGGSGALPLGMTMSAIDFCVLRADGTVACNAGAPGVPTIADPFPATGSLLHTVPNVHDVKEVVTGVMFAFAGEGTGPAQPDPSGRGTCTLHTNGTVSCFVRSSAYLGESETPKLVQLASGPLTDVTHIAAGDGHACAIFGPQSKVACWGKSIYGATGTTSQTPTANVVTGIDGVTALALGTDHTCAARNADVFCWGANNRDQIGGKPSSSTTPEDVLDVNDAVDIQTSMYETCVRTQSGAAKCWPYGDDPSKRAVVVPGLASGVTAVGVDMLSYCFVQSGAVLCFGAGTGGVTTPFSKVPVAVPELATGVVDVTGAVASACAVMNDGSVRCWGLLGSDTTSYRPRTVDGAASAVEISGTGDHRCTRTSAGGVQCFASALGTAQDIRGLSNVASVHATANGACAIIAGSGVMKCWGASLFLAEVATQPTEVPGVSHVAAVDANCFVHENGSVHCANAQHVIAPVAGIVDAARITQGSAATCVVLKSGGVKCWGKNTLGELGNGRVPSSVKPIPIPAP